MSSSSSDSPADEQLRRDALRIWQAAVNAVDSARLVRENVRVEGHWLHVGSQRFDLSAIRRIAVVGAGKAGAGMALGLEEALGPALLDERQVTGWINVPADCVRPLSHIHLHAARPAGVNEPTIEGVRGSLEIMKLVESLSPDDLCLALISGGGSALLPLPIDKISLADKLAVTRFLSAAGAPIEDLNIVRKQISAIKGGKLAAACKAGHLASLIISDVLGDPLDLIASGPTVEDRSSVSDAVEILVRYKCEENGVTQRIFDAMMRPSKSLAKPKSHCQVTNQIIGNNAVAVAAAVREAERLGYATQSESATKSEGAAEEVGQRLADVALKLRAKPGASCLVSGGEPTVKLIAADRRGLGGRNQQLVLAALDQLKDESLRQIVVLSGGTDGEDGPTDAAGALVDWQIAKEAERMGLSPGEFLARNDAYHFFEPLGGLIKTGPTHTNVCDVRVVLTSGNQAHGSE